MTPQTPASTQNIFSQISAFFTTYTASFSYVIWFLIFLGLVVVIVAIVLVTYSLNKEKKLLEIIERKATEWRTFSLPPLGGMFTQYLVKNGWITVNSLSSIFLKGLALIKSKLGENAIYRLPWYLVVGAKDSGKSSICKEIPLMRPFGRTDFSLHETNPLIEWHVLTKGVLIDVAGRVFLNNPEVETDTVSWRELLILLSRYRAARPLNGVVLCIDAKDVYGKNKLSTDALHERANAFMNKLISLQTSLRIRLPIYVMITNSDAIAGFSSFTQDIPAKNRENIFGWSSPYNIQHAFSPAWIEEAFSYINEQLEMIQLEILAGADPNQNSQTPDGVFVFAKELLSIQEALSAYLNRIFHSSSTHDSPILRGIYFSGSVEQSLLTEQSQFQEELLDANAKPPVALAFLRDLFDYKILAESGIARPIEGAIKSLNKGLNIIRNCTIGFVVIGTYGLFEAYDNFSEKKERILPVLGKMNSLLRSMQTLRIDDPGHTGALFDTYARQLLEMMEELQQTEFFSILVPASWFSPLHHDLHASLQIAYQEIVIRTVYVDLLLKARDLLQLRPTAQDRSSSLAALLNPLACSEYLILKKYVEGLYVLNDMLFKFNNLKSAPDAKDLDSLVNYTFNSHLPISFVQQYESFRKILHESSYPLIDLKPYEQMARQTLSILYEAFLNALFSKNDPLTLPSRLQTLVDQLQSQSHRQSPNIDSLRAAVGDLNTTMTSLGDSGATWMDGKVFFPGKEYDQIFDHIDMSPLFGKDVSQYLIDQTAIAFNRFRIFLEGLNTSLVDQPTQTALPPSHGVVFIQKLLTNLFKKSFMAKPDNKPFTAVIPENKLLYWDASLIQFSGILVKDFDDFINKELLDFPLSVQENIKIAARINLQQVLISTLGKAQTFIDMPKDITPGSEAERVLRAQVNDFRQVNDQFVKLLEIVRQDDVSKAYVDLRNLLCNQAQWLLRQIDNYLEHLKLYKTHGDDFSGWNGETGAALEAFAVRDIADLKRYVAVQRQILIAAVNDFAKPLVELLKSPTFDNAEGRDEVLIAHWVGLYDDIEAYGKKQPNNSLSLLEDFLQKDLPVWTYKEAIKNIPLHTVTTASGDYILEVMRNIKLKLLSRAEVLQRQEAIKHYQDLVMRFNKHFKNKFPFVGKNLEDNDGEVSPSDLRDFFNAFKQYGDSPEAILDQLYQLGPFMQDVVDFLQNMEMVKEFFREFLNNKAAIIPSFTIKADFRVAREHEKGGNVVVDWYLKTDEATKIDRQDKKFDGTWNYGQPITVGFTWPESTKVPQPESDNEQDALKVDGVTAEFVYRSQWALLWLLQAQAAPTGSYSKIAEPSPYVLKFRIPMSDQTNTIVFNAISITQAGKGKAPPKIVTLPNFPNSAPDLPNHALELKDKAVLTQGSIQPVAFKHFLEPDNSGDSEADEENQDESTESDAKKPKTTEE